MNSKEYIEYLKENKIIRGNSIVHEYMYEAVKEARKITLDINNNYHSDEEIIDLMTKLTGNEVPSSFRLFPPIYTDFGKNIHIGENVFINSGCSFQDQGGIYIGNNVLIGHQVVFATLNHSLDKDDRASMTHDKIVIEDNVWIGSHATILQGVTIGKNSVVAAGSVVNKDVPSNVVVGGVPAKIIKYL